MREDMFTYLCKLKKMADEIPTKARGRRRRVDEEGDGYGEGDVKGSVNLGLQNCHPNQALPARSASMEVREISHDLTNVK